MKTTDQCWWCANAATHLCDAVIGVERRADGTVILSETYTCDAKLCASHARKVGHLCGDKPDTVDRCPVHAGAQETFQGLPRSQAECDAIRRQIRAQALRSRMRLVGGVA